MAALSRQLDGKGVILQAEVIAIGDELTNGQRLDTNSRWLSQQLGDLGIRTIRHTTVCDDLEANVEALQLAANRADIVICTGGLGPTLDDLTRQAMADAFDRPLQLHQASLERIQQMFAQRSREMPERNRIQAFFPEGSQVIENPHGSAPGIDLQVDTSHGRSRLFALPGVPAEMRQMWAESVVPRIETMIGDERGTMRCHQIKVFGIGESDVEVRLPNLIERRREPVVGITVSRATITLRIVGRATTDEEFQRLIAPTTAEIQQALGDLVFGHGEDELQHVVLRQLRDSRKHMASMEIGAASWVGDWMLAVNGTRDHFAGSLAVPSMVAAHRWLTGSQSAEPRCEDDDAAWQGLVRELQRRFDAEVALVTGVYPTEEQMTSAQVPFQPVFALGLGEQIFMRRTSMGGHPDVLGPRIGKTGLDLVRRGLAGLPLEC
jgi:nicotinamide-nucleotide amidase